MLANKTIKYFKGLNGLRFFAAYLVVIHHAEQIRLKYGMFNLKQLSIFNQGGTGVTFFFVLSGFLITYLLLKEDFQTKNISIRSFYLRRVLRIWPLYFLLVLIGIVIVPILLSFINFNYQMPYTFSQTIFYFIFFMPFVVNILFGHHLLEPLWSIGVEELFYLIWAPLVKFIKKNILILIFSIIFIKLFLLTFFHFTDNETILSQIVSILKFEAMAIGGLGAYFIFNLKNELKSKLLFSIPAQIIIILLIIIPMFGFTYLTKNFALAQIIFDTPIISSVFNMFLFSWLIINISQNSKSILKFENKILNFLGDISYGIYMYHMLIIFGVTLFFAKLFNNLNNTFASILFYIIITFATILVSAISKKYFENKFLNLKKRFEK